jgi:toxin ParE1/3/4
MARRIIWYERAAVDLESIAEYIAQDSEFYAASVVRSILQKSRRLAEFPFIGRVVPEFDDQNIREIFAYSFRIIYTIGPDEVQIAAVIHGKRQLDISLKP